MNDDELEAMFRSSLADHASEAVPAADPVADAHAGARRRRRVIGAIAGAAAIVVVAPAAVVAVTLGHGGSNAADPAVPSVAGGWRAESYNGIELRVPVTWGWGATPATSGPDHCVVMKEPYVGRPMGPAELRCMSNPPAHVWFDSSEPVGSRDGQTTVRVQGATTFNITVADTDRADRQRILDSIHPVTTDSNGCPVKPAKFPWGSQDPNLPDATNASVCLYYTSVTQAGRTHYRTYLYYSTRVLTSVPELVREINAAGPGPRIQPADLCVTENGVSFVDLIVRSAAASTTYGISSRVCEGQGIGYDTQPDFHVLTKASVALWAIDGVPVYARNGRDPTYLGYYLP